MEDQHTPTISLKSLRNRAEPMNRDPMGKSFPDRSKRRRQETQQTVKTLHCINPVSQKLPSRPTHLFCTEQQQQQRTDWKVLSKKEIIVSVRKPWVHDRG